MLGKLMKYDCRSMFRSFAPLWLALLALSVVNHFTVDLPNGGIGAALAMLAYVGVVIAVIVVTIVLVVLRFYHGLLRDEGYLMFTLPVRPWQLVMAKLLTALVVTVLSIAVSVLSLFIIVGDLHGLQNFIKAVFRAIPQISGTLYLQMFLLVVLVIAAILASITHIYASLAIGHLFHTHRIGWAVGAYIVTDILFTFLLTLTMQAGDRTFLPALLPPHLSPAASANAILGLMIAWCVVMTALCYVATERILARRLNLQ